MEMCAVRHVREKRICESVVNTQAAASDLSHTSDRMFPVES